MVSFGWFYFFDILPGFLLLTLGIYALYKSPADPIARSFFFFTLALWLSGLLGAILGTATNIGEAIRIDNLHLLAAYLIFSSFLYFCLTFYRRAAVADPLSLLLVFLPSGILYLLATNTRLINLQFYRSYYGYYSLPGPLHFLSYLIIIAYMLGGIFLLLKAWHQASDKLRRQQARWLISGTLIPIISGSLTDVLLPLLGIKSFSLLMFSTYFMGGAFFIALTRYRLVSLLPRTAISAIARAIPDALVVTDLQGKISYTNEATGNLFAGTLINKNIFSLLPSPPEGGWPRPESGTVPARFEAELSNGLGGKFPADISLALLRDKTGAADGLLWDIRDLSADLYFKKQLISQQETLQKKISELQQANEELRGREKELANLKEEVNRLRQQLGIPLY